MDTNVRITPEQIKDIEDYISEAATLRTPQAMVGKPAIEWYEPNSALARSYLIFAQVPESMISTHPGKNGKMFKYVKHVHATVLMNIAFPGLWSQSVLREGIMNDGSAYAVVRLVVKVPRVNQDGSVTFYEQSVEEIGAFKTINGGMPDAMQIASAVSRGFVKCIFRMFGFGRELYEGGTDELMTPQTAWSKLAETMRTKGVTTDQFAEVWKSKGYTKNDLVDKFDEAYSIIYEIASENKVAAARKAAGENPGAGIPESIGA